MATTLLPPSIEQDPAVEREPFLSDDGVIGGGGGPREPDDDQHRDPERDPEPDPRTRATPLSAYRAATSWAIGSVVMVFSTLTFVVKARWSGSDDWVSVALPRVLYLDTAILLVSSLTIEFARNALRKHGSRDCVRWLFVTLALGLAFLAGQVVAWRDLVSRGLYLGSNPGSFFIYMISATHGLHVLGGIAALAIVGFLFHRWKQKRKQETAVSAIALYWHFMDALWIYLLVLLFITVQR
ncbi:MAG TPA: cytochrome c oxidase subunit 3 [Candidatus Aquilonibacter sp.]|nr:cytochrome c oxidase subunit 3 [Candidatus Aquilonibacter sp.]